MQPSRDPSPAVSGTAPSRDYSLLLVITFVLRNLRLLLIGGIVGLVVGLATAILGRSEFEAISAFSPQSSASNSARLAGLAAQFGIGVPGGLEASESVEFYAELLRSRGVTEALATTPLEIGPSDSLTFIEAYDIDADSEARRLLEAAELLDDLIDINIKRSSNVVEVRTVAFSPYLATAMNRHLLELMSEFNLLHRQSQARLEREFTAERLREAHEALRLAEDELQRFLESNKTYQSSPQLSFEAARLQRNVELRQQVYISLSQTLEQARIEEVRSTPVVTIIDPPEGSARPVRFSWILPLVGGLLGLAIASVIALWRSYLSTKRSTDPEEYESFLQAIQRFGS